MSYSESLIFSVSCLENLEPSCLHQRGDDVVRHGVDHLIKDMKYYDGVKDV